MREVDLMSFPTLRIFMPAFLLGRRAASISARLAVVTEIVVASAGLIFLPDERRLHTSSVLSSSLSTEKRTLTKLSSSFSNDENLLPLCTQIKTRICVVLSDSSCQEDTPWTKLSFKTAWLIPPTLFFTILHQRIHPVLIAIYNTILIGWPTQNPLIDGEYRKGLFILLITFRML